MLREVLVVGVSVGRDLIIALQRRCARVAVGASTVRGQGAPGLVAAAREHLHLIDLAKFGVSRPALVRTRLDVATRRLMAALPARGRSWGIARKVLNIFLRDALYTVYLREKFRLDRAESLFEVPLDAVTVKALRRECARGFLPKWRGVKRLTPEESRVFQSAARELAASRGVSRVHLDAFWWGIRDVEGS